MIWKGIFVAVLAVGAMGQFSVTEENRQQFKTRLREYCTKNGAADKADAAEKAVTEFVDCLKGLVNVTVLQEEIDQAKPNGALDEVFKKYCAKSPQLKTCLHSLTSSMAPCVDATARAHIAGIDNATDQLIDFVCYKDGDRIALFIAEGGPDCFKEQFPAIMQCGKNLKGSVPDVEAAKALSLKEKCGKFNELTSCVVTALESCQTPTPGNMAESLFRYVKNGSPCKDVK